MSVQEPSRGTSVVDVSGELDMATAPQLRTVLESICLQDGAAPSRLVLNLGAVPFMDCSGFRPIEDAARRLEARQADFEIAPASPPVRRLLDLLGRSHLVARPAQDPPAADLTSGMEPLPTGLQDESDRTPDLGTDTTAAGPPPG